MRNGYNDVSRELGAQETLYQRIGLGINTKNLVSTILFPATQMLR